jgi:hypothetical protein
VVQCVGTVWSHLMQECVPEDLACNWRQFFVRFEVFTVVTMKNAAFWDVTLCGSCKN